MEFARKILICSSIVIISYIIWLGITTSSTHAAIKEYGFLLGSSSFPELILDEISAKKEWKYEVSDTLVSNSGETRYWVNLYYKDKIYDIKYSLHFRSRHMDHSNEAVCDKVELIGAFDQTNRVGGYKMSDEGVPKLVSKIEESLLEDLAPKCN